MMNMRLDFSRPQRRARRRGKAFAVMILASALAALLYHYDLTQKTLAVQDGEAAKTISPRRTPAGSAAMAPVTADELRLAHRVLADLERPWERYFKALESVSSRDITMLALDPAAGGAVKIEGEARDIVSMFNYIRQLHAAGVFSRIVLQSHQIQIQEPQKPVRFVLEGFWKPRQ